MHSYQDLAFSSLPLSSTSFSSCCPLDCHHTTSLPPEVWTTEDKREEVTGGVVGRGLAAAAIAVVEGGRVCRRGRREGARSYVCKVCDRRFPRAYLLLVHERTHSPLTCPVCGKTFRRSEHLRLHRESHGSTKRHA
ncbi:hypothetical protein Pcinc_025619 [Petrolisthes cinctipes]|uniref:C2H2-type domain-containing protein n=1 Tax=Petrolisthes cinctipes TaxID=88211 RepID=A0AAE1F8X0_PETCI|nr:hypothetical protein Pcinc_025619 [Petrolisthes cinctipes]